MNAMQLVPVPYVAVSPQFTRSSVSPSRSAQSSQDPAWSSFPRVQQGYWPTGIVNVRRSEQTVRLNANGDLASEQTVQLGQATTTQQYAPVVVRSYSGRVDISGHAQAAFSNYLSSEVKAANECVKQLTASVKVSPPPARPLSPPMAALSTTYGQPASHAFSTAFSTGTHTISVNVPSAPMLSGALTSAAVEEDDTSDKVDTVEQESVVRRQSAEPVVRRRSGDFIALATSMSTVPAFSHRSSPSTSPRPSPGKSPSLGSRYRAALEERRLLDQAIGDAIELDKVPKSKRAADGISPTFRRVPQKCSVSPSIACRELSRQSSSSSRFRRDEAHSSVTIATVEDTLGTASASKMTFSTAMRRAASPSTSNSQLESIPWRPSGRGSGRIGSSNSVVVEAADGPTQSHSRQLSPQMRNWQRNNRSRSPTSQAEVVLTKIETIIEEPLSAREEPQSARTSSPRCLQSERTSGVSVETSQGEPAASGNKQVEAALESGSPRKQVETAAEPGSPSNVRLQSPRSGWRFSSSTPQPSSTPSSPRVVGSPGLVSPRAALEQQTSYKAVAQLSPRANAPSSTASSPGCSPRRATLEQPSLSRAVAPLSPRVHTPLSNASSPVVSPHRAALAQHVCEKRTALEQPSSSRAVAPLSSRAHTPSSRASSTGCSDRSALEQPSSSRTSMPSSSRTSRTVGRGCSPSRSPEQTPRHWKMVDEPGSPSTAAYPRLAKSSSQKSVSSGPPAGGRQLGQKSSSMSDLGRFYAEARRSLEKTRSLSSTSRSASESGSTSGRPSRSDGATKTSSSNGRENTTAIRRLLQQSSPSAAASKPSSRSATPDAAASKPSSRSSTPDRPACLNISPTGAKPRTSSYDRSRLYRGVLSGGSGAPPPSTRGAPPPRAASTRRLS